MYKKVIIAPLNWGLGHASRCIPLINSLLKNKIEVVLASDGEALALLKLEFPFLKYYELPGYNIRYKFTDPLLNMLWHSTGFLKAVIKEHRQIKHIAAKEKADLIISDNRFGVYKQNVHSIFITHQTHLLTGYPWLDPFADVLNSFLIRKFDQVWIPDFEPPKQIAPKLSKTIKNKSCSYIGILSRFAPKDAAQAFDLCAVLSGPEPQRTYFENILIHSMNDIRGNHILVSGKTMEYQEKQQNNLHIVSFMTSEKLNDTINKSAVIIARSGYSTIMDLLKAGKKAILVPTPGQPEQIYLAEALKNHPNFVVQTQNSIQIAESIHLLKSKKPKTYHTPEFDVCHFFDKKFARNSK